MAVAIGALALAACGSDSAAPATGVPLAPTSAPPASATAVPPTNTPVPTLEAAGANLLGGLGDFSSISGASTAFNELAELADLGAALEQDGSFALQAGVIDIFGGNLFGSN